MSARIIGYTSSASGWNNLMGEIMDPIDEAQAREHHDADRTYGAIVADPDGVPIQVGIVSGFGVAVEFHEPSGRHVIESRDFRLDDDRLWLRGIRRHNGSTTRGVAVADWFTWADADGPATWQRFDAEHRRGADLGQTDDWDPDDHWFERPSFGDYDALVAPALLDRLWPGLPALPLVTG